MRCRECLLTLMRELTDGSDIAQGDDLPKSGDFPGWNERIANAIAPGSSEEHVRGYLKTTAERAWRLANWLTHAANATRDDAELTLSATSHVINNYALSVLKRKTESTREIAPDANHTRLQSIGGLISAPQGCMPPVHRMGPKTTFQACRTPSGGGDLTH